MQQQLAVVSNTDAVHESSVVAADVAPAGPVAAAPDPFLTAPRKASSEPWECQRCTVTSTTCRRSGPGGRSTLCNGMCLWGGCGGGGAGGVLIAAAFLLGGGRVAYRLPVAEGLVTDGFPFPCCFLLLCCVVLDGWVGVWSIGWLRGTWRRSLWAEVEGSAEAGEEGGCTGCRVCPGYRCRCGGCRCAAAAR